jgi:hypothetical protein
LEELDLSQYFVCQACEGGVRILEGSPHLDALFVNPVNGVERVSHIRTVWFYFLLLLEDILVKKMNKSGKTVRGWFWDNDNDSSGNGCENHCPILRGFRVVVA